MRHQLMLAGLQFNNSMITCAGILLPREFSIFNFQFIQLSSHAGTAHGELPLTLLSPFFFIDTTAILSVMLNLCPMGSYDSILRVALIYSSC